MRLLALIIILVVAATFALKDIIERSFESDIRVVIEEQKPPAATSSEPAPGPTFSPATGFKGPTGDPKVNGPKFPPPNY